MRIQVMKLCEMRFRRNIERIGKVLGYELSKNLFYDDTHLWIATMDDNKLSDIGYIVPGPGDAGDLSFGIKL